MRVGIMTGGGDAPGLNGVIESVVRSLRQKNIETIGIKNGFEGIYQNQTVELTLDSVSHAHSFAGTLLGSSNKSFIKGNETNFIEQYRKLNLSGLVVCGGDGTFQALQNVKEHVNIVGVPKTIDNDLHGTDQTFGFDTACTVVSESIDSLRYTAEAHERIIVVETMGRTAGWISLCSGLSSYADVILIPERAYNKTKLIEFIKQKKSEGRKSLMIVVSEGAHEQSRSAVVAFTEENSPEKNRLGGIAFQLSREIEKETHWESRHVVLGHLQRSRQPSHYDRLLTLQLGSLAADLVCRNDWNKAVGLISGKIVEISLLSLMQGPKLVDNENIYVKNAQSMGIFI